MSNSDPQTNSSHYSDQSSNTFLAVPRLIDPPAIDPPFQRHVSFQDPKQLQKSEHKESIEEQDLYPSKQSFDKRSLYQERNSHGLSGYQQSYNSDQSHKRYLEVDRDEEYRRLKLFQVEMERIVQRHNGKFRLTRTRKSSDNLISQTPKQLRSQYSKDSFKVSPQFKPYQGLQLVQVALDPQQRLRGDLSEMDLTQRALQHYNQSPQSIDISLHNEYGELQSAQPRFITVSHQVQYPLRSWDRATLIAISFVARLLSSLRVPGAHNKFLLFKKSYFVLIGDLASSFAFFKKIGLMRRTRSLEKSIIKKRWYIAKLDICNSNALIIEPTNPLRLAWISFVSVWYLIGTALIVYETCFDVSSTWIPAYITLISLDMAVLMNTAVYQDGRISLSRAQIFQVQRMNMLYDIGIVILLLLLLNVQTYLGWPHINQIGLLIVARLLRVRDYWQELEDIAELAGRVCLPLKMTRLLASFLLVGHMCACGLYLAGQSDSSETWLNRTTSKEQAYTAALSWSMMTMANVGSTQLTFPSQQEQTYLIFVAVVAVGMMAYLLTEVARFVAQKNFSNHRTQLIMQFYRQRGLPTAIQYQLRKYYEFRTYQQTTIKEDQLLWELLHKDLKETLSVNLYGKVIRSSKLFTQHFSDALLDDLCTRFQYVQFEKGHVVLHQATQCDRLVFIVEGEVSQVVLMPYDQARGICKYTQGPLDETQFLLHGMRGASYQASTDVKLAFIEYPHFYETLKAHPADFERFAMLKDNLAHNQSFITKSTRCSNCQNRGHQLLNCPFVHLVIDKQQVIRHFNVSLPADRSRFFRNDNKRFNTRLNKNLISITAISFAIGQKFHRESELTNEVMNKLQGSHQVYEDSLFCDIDEKTQRTYIDKQYTTYSRQTDPQLLQAMNSPQNTLGSNTTQQQNTLPVKMETMNDRDSSFYSSKNNIKQGSINSIKVNVIKSSVSSDHLLQQHEKLRLNKKKATNSTGSLRQDRNKMSYMTANPPQNPLQQAVSPQPINQSTSIMQHSLNYTNQTSAFSHAQEEEILHSDQSPMQSSPLAAGNVIRYRIDFWECDRITNYKYFFPAYNFDAVASRTNQRQKRTLTFREEMDAKLQSHIKCQTEKVALRDNNDLFQYSMK